MRPRNPIDSLQLLSPVSDTEAAELFTAAGRDDLLDGVTRLPFGRRARAPYAPRRGRRRLVLAVAAFAVVGVGTAATWVALQHAPARETTSVQCLIGSSDAVIPSSSGNPVHDCVAGWRQEYGTTPPKLQAYDNALGGVTVIPASQTPPAGWKPIASQDVSLIELQDSLDDVINGLNSSCLSSTAATSLAEGKLAQFGFAGWTVSVREAGAPSGPGMCTSVDVVDPTAQSVTLIPSDGLTASGTTLELGDKLRPITQSCDSLPDAVAAVRSAASSLGIPPSNYDLNATQDDSLRCASVYETVGGTIFLTVRGPRS